MIIHKKVSQDPMPASSDPHSELEAQKREVSAAVIAAIQAGAALLGTPSLSAKRVSLRLRQPLPDSDSNEAQVNSDAAERPLLNAPSVSAEDLKAVHEAALAAFPESVRVAARARLEALATPEANKRLPSTPLDLRPSPIPTELPSAHPTFEAPPYPSRGLDHPAVRAEWDSLHRKALEARFLLEPLVLRAYAEAQLACEKWDARQRGRKPSGDLRHPIARDRLEQIVAKMTKQHEQTIERAEATIAAIASGDVVDVDMLQVDVGRADIDIDVPKLILKSELDRKAAKQLKRANRTPEEISAARAEWDDMVERMIADLQPDEPEPEIPNLPDLPGDREPTALEVAAFSNAIRKHISYLERGEQIEAKKRRDAAIKSRTAARRAAEEADPQGSLAAKEAVRRAKAADRQRRWRERKKASKNGGA